MLKIIGKPNQHQPNLPKTKSHSRCFNPCQVLPMNQLLYRSKSLYERTQDSKGTDVTIPLTVWG